MSGSSLSAVVELERRRLDDVDLALLQRVDLRLRVAQREVPLDAVDVDVLAAGGPEGGSLRGTYFGFFRYTALSPGLNSSA